MKQGFLLQILLLAQHVSLSTTGTQWAMRYRTSQIMYQINVIHMSLEVKPQRTIISNIIFKIKI